MPEEWRPVQGWPYDVSSLGRVRSIRRVLSDGRTAGAKLLAQPPDAKGYRRVTLRAAGRSRTVRVHVLVAEAFIGPRPKGLQVLHRNDDHSRNDVKSLRYGTDEENKRERMRREMKEKREARKERGRKEGEGRRRKEGERKEKRVGRKENKGSQVTAVGSRPCDSGVTGVTP